jgi:hypothetical protein
MDSINRVKSGQKRILILGSCVSRDILELDGGHTLDLVAYCARSSFASAFADGPFPVDQVDTSLIASSFQKRMVEIDLYKRLPRIIEDCEYDLLLVDLIDERFSLFKEEGGNLCTASNELLSAGVTAKKFEEEIEFGSELHFKLWKKGWDAFIAKLESINKLDCLRLNKVYWAECMSDRKTPVEGFAPKYIVQANSYLRRLYAYINKTLPPQQIIHFDSEVFVAAEKHKWGVSPFHYSSDYYREALKGILADRPLNALDYGDTSTTNLPDFDVLLNRIGEDLHAKVEARGSGLNADFQYAFYLLLNGVRKSVVWYTFSNLVAFNMAGPGVYRIAAFVRCATNHKLKSSKLSDQIGFNVPAYDLSKWGKGASQVDSEEFFELKELTEGVLTINFDRVDVDFLVKGIDRLDARKVALVCFSGAISNREFNSAPFFSGINIAEQINLPVISIADPSLALSGDLLLSWYAGFELSVDLPEIVAKILDHISLMLGAKLVLFGGSGGGYAALSVVQIMASKASVFVWNPQTSISKYVGRHVVNYITTCFPSAKTENDLYETLEHAGIRHDLNSVYSSHTPAVQHDILYIQNEGDNFHVTQHAAPFMRSLNVEQVDEKVYTSAAGVCFWFKYWGDGHLVPSREVILAALEGLADGLSPLDISKRL